jgi:hypothetical protein
MSEQEKIDIITFIKGELKHLNDNIESIKDFIDVKYATKHELNLAKETRDAFCLVREDKIDKKFIPVYIMLGALLLFMVAKYGVEVLSLIIKVV